jgi:hypothetical protein
MPPFKKIPKTEAAAAAQGLASMTSFFSAKKFPGRPAKKTPKSGRPAAEKAPAPAAGEDVQKQDLVQSGPQSGARRQNWNKTNPPKMHRNGFSRSKSSENHGENELDDLPAAFHKAIRAQCDLDALELRGLAMVRAHIMPPFVCLSHALAAHHSG